MQGQDSTLLRLMEGSGRRFIIPVYQRYYDWKKENCKQLFDDLITVQRENKRSHFFGSIVSYSYKKDEIVLIDGQQRVTTISLLLIAIMNAIRDKACAFENASLADEIEEKYIIDKWRKDERKVRLKPFRDDCKAFDLLIAGNKQEYIQSSKVTINYNYFYNRIIQDREISVEELYDAIEKLVIIDIDLEPERGDDPQLIFESLNSTGLDLTESDKIRNFILMGLDPDTQDRYYDQYWNKIEKCCGLELDAFVRDFLTITTGNIPTIKAIYSSFKQYTKQKEEIEEVLQEMLTYAIAYNKLATYNIGSIRANEIAKHLDLLDMTVANPFLMAFLAYADEEQMNEHEIENVLACTETYIFRRLMCDLPTNALNKIFALLHKSVLKNMYDGYSYSEVMIYLLESRKQSGTFPKDADFIQGLTSKNIYSMRAKNKEYIFERLENMSSKEKNDVVQNIEDNILSIEHIMPQTLNKVWKESLGEKWEEIQEKWLHTISNLTLTGYNSSYSNHSFLEKRDCQNGFAESGLRLNQYIAQFNQWTEKELLLRKEKISNLALKIWEYPQTSFKPIQKEDDIVYLSEDNSVPVNRKVSYFIFQGTQVNVHNWVGLMRQMIKILYNIDPTILYKEAADASSVWFSTYEKNDFEKIADGLYFCVGGHSTWIKMSILKRLFRKYNIDEDELSFGLLPSKEEQEPTPTEEIVSIVNENEIKQWKSNINPPDTVWLTPASEKYFRLADWFENHDYVYWDQYVNYSVGNLIYIYVSNPIKKIKYLCQVEEVNVTDYHKRDEQKYYRYEQAGSDSKVKRMAKLKLIKETENADLLSLDILQENGLSKAPQSSIKLKGELLEYLQKNF